jgi:ribose transport system substrate-binding protein
VHYGADQAAKELGVEIEWLGSQSEKDRDGQITTVQNFITKKVDGIVLAPQDSQALIDVVREARDAKVPVVIFDSALADDSLIVSYVATDNFRSGELAAEEMVKRLNGKGKVILLRYAPGSESTEQREEGFLAKLKEFPGIEVLSSNQFAGHTTADALAKAETLLNQYRNEVNGIFAVCEPNATGVLQALEDSEGLAGKVIFIGFDPTDRMVAALAAEKMHGIAVQDPVKMGYLATKTMVQHLRGEKVEKRISTGEHIATPANMKQPDIDRLLHPPQYQ